jgi:hypothetical protein
MMIRKVIVVSFSLLMLPLLSQAQCADNTSPECRQVDAIKTVGTRQDGGAPSGLDMPHDRNPNNGTISTTATTQATPSPRKNKRRSQHQSPRYETADPRDTVLSSEICVYSSATYTYTCR